MTNVVPTPTASREESSRAAIFATAGLLVLLAFAAYHNSFSGPLIYDDTSSITDNLTIRHLWPLTDVLVPPRDSGVTVNGRPVLNLTLAINYAISGTEVWSYHVINLLVHALAGLTLFGVVRRTLLRPAFRPRFGSSALFASGTIAALWMAHPLQTESVTYVIQRAEALVGLFYLLTLYGFVRSIESPASRFWPAATFVACLLGMATKEVMVSAPIIVLLYDRTFVAGSFAGAWEKRRPLHLSLFATWLLLAVLVISTGGRGGTVGFGVGGVTWWAYAFTQCRAILQYLWLAVWPRGLVFDYGVAVDKNFLAIWPQAVAIVALVGGTVYALWRRPAVGFLGTFFLAVLAPSSSILPIATETMAEHRMYLPLAAALVLGGAIGVTLCGRRSLWPGVLLCLSAVLVTTHRNQDYRDELRLWTDTVNKWPSNARAHNNVGEVLFRTDNRTGEAIQEFREAIRLLPGYVYAVNNLGNALARVGQSKEAIAVLNRALKMSPDNTEILNNLGSALHQEGNPAEAAEKFRAALKLKADYADPHNNLAVILTEAGQFAEAAEHCREAIRVKPRYADAHYNYGNALRELKRLPEAIAEFEEALRIKPDYAEAHCNLANLLLNAGQTTEAVHHYVEAIRLKPDYADAHNNYGAALSLLGRNNDAIAEFREAVRLNPAHTDAKKNLLRMQSGSPQPE